jgi:hypothetical protein
MRDYMNIKQNGCYKDIEGKKIEVPGQLIQHRHKGYRCVGSEWSHIGLVSLFLEGRYSIPSAC